MSATGFTRITWQGAVLNPVAWHVDPSLVHEHLDAICKESIGHRAAISVIAATLPLRIRQIQVEIVRLDRHP
jgi:hypothetical protein